MARRSGGTAGVVVGMNDFRGKHAIGGRAASRAVLLLLPTTVPLLVLLAVLPAEIQAAGRGLSQSGMSDGSGGGFGGFNFGFNILGMGGGFGFGGSQASSGAGAAADGSGGRGRGDGVGDGSSSQADASAAVDSYTVHYAPRFGLDSQNGARCFASALAGSFSFAGLGSASGAQSSAGGLAVGGSGLGSLASCGAQASATSSALSCQRYTAPESGNLCDFSGNFATSCDGLKLVNPGVDYVQSGQTINVPPCRG